MYDFSKISIFMINEYVYKFQNKHLLQLLFVIHMPIAVEIYRRFIKLFFLIGTPHVYQY